VEAVARGMSSLLPSIAGAVVSGVIFYFVGLHQGRQQIRFERRADAVTELRKRLREAKQALADLSTPAEYRSLPGIEEPPRSKLADAAGEKLNALTSYHQDHALWLDERTSEKLDDLTDEYASRWAAAEGSVGEEVEEDAMMSLWDWLGGDEDRTDEVLDALDRSLRDAAPWWRSIFSGR
jgi:hypothetical protein